MSKALIGSIFSLNILTLAVGSANFLQTLNAPQSQLLDSLKPCTIRMVFLENSFAAAEDISWFLNFYKNQASFILEPISFDFRKFKINSTLLATSKLQDKRFMTCFSIFYFQDQIFDILSDSDKKQHIYSYFVTFSVYLRNEDPASIIFMNFRNSTVGNEYSLVKDIDTTSSFYILAFADQFVGLICVTCSTLVAVKSFSESCWRQIHIQTEIPVSSLYTLKWDTEPINSFDSCGISPFERFTSQSQPYHDVCIYRELQQRLNATDSQKKGIHPYGYVTWYYLNKLSVEHLFKKHSVHRSVCLSYGMVNIDYRFGTVIHPYGYDISSLVRPFNSLTWSLLIVSIASLCICFRFIFRFENKQNLSETHVLSIVMEQSQNIVTNCGNLQKQNCILLVCFMLLAFISANAYKGVIFTILTALWYPMVPKTLEEVVKSDFFKQSITSYYTTPEGTFGSVAKYDIDNFLEEVEQSRLNISNMDLYKNLKESIVYLGYNYSPSLIFLSMEKGQELKGQNGNYTVVPKTFIIFDKEVQVQLFKELVSMFTISSKLVLGQKINLRPLGRQWVLRRNAVARLASPIFKSLVESGIYDQWKQYRSIAETYQYLNFAKHRLLNFYNVSNSHISRKDNIIAYLFFKPYTAQRSSENEQPITIEFFFVFAQMLLYCVAFCCISFSVERLCKVKFGLLLNAVKQK